jgi:hypothetical protein
MNPNKWKKSLEFIPKGIEYTGPKRFNHKNIGFTNQGRWVEDAFLWNNKIKYDERFIFKIETFDYLTAYEEEEKGHYIATAKNISIKVKGKKERYKAMHVEFADLFLKRYIGFLKRWIKPQAL